jgi:hypothetical protein
MLSLIVIVCKIAMPIQSKYHAELFSLIGIIRQTIVFSIKAPPPIGFITELIGGDVIS